MKVTIIDMIDVDVNFIIDINKDEDVWVITTYISRKIHFHISGIDNTHAFYNKMKSLFDKVIEIQFMQ